jgi:hypothetical protein
MIAVVYDAGALIAADRSDSAFYAFHSVTVAKGSPRLVPSGVLARVWRDSGRQARLSRTLRTCTVVPLDAADARGAGVLCGRAGTDDVIDASVVLLAARHRTGIVTGDRGDIGKLLDALEPGVRRPPIYEI